MRFLQIRILSCFIGRVVVAAEEDSCASHFRALPAHFALSHNGSIIADISLFVKLTHPVSESRLRKVKLKMQK